MEDHANGTGEAPAHASPTNRDGMDNSAIYDVDSSDPRQMLVDRSGVSADGWKRDR